MALEPSHNPATTMSATILLLALTFERLRGDPATAYHPVAWFGRYAGLIEQALHSDHRAAGAMAWLAAVIPPLLGIAWLHVALWDLRPWSGLLFDAALLWTTLGWRSLLGHVRSVAEATGLTSARMAAARIVGRDPEALDEAGIHRAALESLAENSSDAVVAPLFWFVVAGPLGAAAYRMVNTLDAMWGHRSPRYLHFGTAAARIDDVANWIPARLTAGLIVLAARRHDRAPVGGHPVAEQRRPIAPRTWAVRGRGPLLPQLLQTWRSLAPQATQHPSPNGGWPEAALAWGLGVRLGGAVLRAGHLEARPWLGPDGGREPTPRDTLAGLVLIHRALLLAAVAMLIVLGLEAVVSG